MKFFKSFISTFKEGWEEGKAELADEQQKEAADAASQKEKALAVPHQEAFGTALAAPFRIVIFGDWFTLFKSTSEENEHLYPLHLYTFGDYPKKQKHFKELKKVLKRDFNIIDKNSCLNCVNSLMSHANIPIHNTTLHSESLNTKPSIQLGSTSPALHAAVLAHILTASTDVDYLEKNDAQQMLNAIGTYITSHYDTWDSYAKAFIEGETEARLNHTIGKNVLKKYLGYLKTKQGSPWRNVDWK